MKLKALYDNRIRIQANGEKVEIAEGEIVEVPYERVNFFLVNGFVKCEDVLDSDEIQTTDGARKSTRGRKHLSK